MSVVGIGEVEGGDEAEAVTAAAATADTVVHYYSVAPGVRLKVRSGPGTTYGVVRTLAEGAKVPIYCQTPGQTVTGPYGTSKIWDSIADGQYVSDAYIHTGTDGYVASRCSCPGTEPAASRRHNRPVSDETGTPDTQAGSPGGIPGDGPRPEPLRFFGTTWVNHDNGYA